MLSKFAHHWWLAVLRGVLAIGLGVVAFTLPGLTLGALVTVFGAYALIDGIMSVGFGLFGGSSNRRWAAILSGALGILAGLATLAQPAATVLVLLYIIAGWAMVTGVIQVADAIRLRDSISDEWLMGLGGVLSVLFGILLLTAPASGVLTLVFLFGFYTISTGVAQIGFGLRLRNLADHLPLLHRSTAASSS